MVWVRGVSAALSSVNRGKTRLDADGEASAAESGAELLSLGLVSQLHRPEVFAP